MIIFVIVFDYCVCGLGFKCLEEVRVLLGVRFYGVGLLLLLV